MTLGHEIVDNFYVCDQEGSKVVSESRLHQIEQSILAALES